MPSLSLAEQETIINWNRAEDAASIYTHDKGLMAMLERRRFLPVREYRFDGRVVAKAYEVPRDILQIKLKGRQSSAQRAAALANLQKATRSKSTPQAAGVSQPIAPKTGTDREQPGKPPAGHVTPEKTAAGRAAQ